MVARTLWTVPQRSATGLNIAQSYRLKAAWQAQHTTETSCLFLQASGSEKGLSYELPALGKASWENQVACPHSGEKTVVVGLDDSNDGQVYVYIGHKQASTQAECLWLAAVAQHWWFLPATACSCQVVAVAVSPVYILLGI